MDPGPSLLVCVYYRVTPSDQRVAIARAREFQRTLLERHPGLAMEVLVRSDPCPAALAAAVASGSEAAADVTLMETYRLTSLPFDPGPQPTAVAVLLADIDSAASPLAPLLRGPRHVEVFSPCAW